MFSKGNTFSTESSPKKICKSQISTLRSTQHHQSVGKWKLKPKCDTTTHSLKWLKLKRYLVPRVDKDVEELELSYEAGGNIESYNHFGQFASFLKC